MATTPKVTKIALFKHLSSGLTRVINPRWRE